jgi:hypothetical protein
MMRRITVLLFILTGFSLYELKAQDENGYMLLINSPLSFQQGFGFKQPYYRKAFDVNFSLIVLNLGYNYQQYYGSNGYIGLGLGSGFQLQYGYGFNQEKHLIRFRSDWPLYSFVKNKLSFLAFCSVGIFCEHTFNDKNKGFNIGITIGGNLATLLTLKDNIANKKKKDSK